MIETHARKLSEHFYHWENKCRGLAVYEVPVDLEPAFEPFFSHVPLVHEPVPDDGKRPTVLSTVADAVRSFFHRATSIPTVDESVEAFAYDNDLPLQSIAIVFPNGAKVRPDETERLLQVLTSCRYPIAFEIVGDHEKIVVQYTCSACDVGAIKNQMKAHFPQCTLIEKEDALLRVVDGESEVLDVALSEEFMRPLAMVGSYDPDPLTAMFGFLDHLPFGASGAVQVLFSKTINSWNDSIVRSVTSNDGDAFFENAPEMVALAKQKTSASLFAVVVRCIGAAPTKKGAVAIADQIAFAIAHASASSSNSLFPIVNESYDEVDHLEDVLCRRSRRLGMLFNVKELATIAHYPSASVFSSKLVRNAKRTKQVATIEKEGVVIGNNEFEGRKVLVRLTNEQRLRHTHIIGATGTGKSTLLKRMIVGDIIQGNGVAVLDPHGDLIEHILSYIPESRVKDVLLIDPADAEHPIGFNVLSAHSAIERDILASDLVASFRRQSTSWGDQMNSVFANAIIAFLESAKGGTLADLRRFLIEKSFRDTFLKTVQDEHVLYYWNREYPLLKSSSIGSILTRLDSFLRPRIIRNMVCQEKSPDFDFLMDTNKIVLVKLSQGLIGAENSFLLGTFVVSKLHQAAMARQAQAQVDRKSFFLYIDEFQHFTTPSMVAMLSGARKYGLGLVLAHQNLNQLQDSELAASLLANAGTRICFRLGDTDARKLEDGFSFFTASDLQNLTKGEAIVRIDTPSNDFNLATAPLTPSEVPATVQESILQYSRETYGTRKEVVEQRVSETMRGTKEIETHVSVKDTNATGQPQPIVEQLKESEPPKVIAADALIEKSEERQHRQLQNWIADMGKNMGYKATIEAPTLDGHGLVDVLLERNGKTIACEVSITTSVEWEMHNVEKCINAGFGAVIICIPDTNNLKKMRSAIQETGYGNTLALDPDALVEHLQQQLVEDSNTEVRLQGYKVKVQYKSIPEEDTKHKRENVMQRWFEWFKKREG